MMMIGKGTAKKKIATKARPASRDHDAVAQRAPADAHHRLDDDGEHGGFQAEEQRLDIADIAEGGIDVAQAHDGDDAGQDEEAARHQPARSSVHQPADIGRKLLRLGARQQHAVVQCMQETALGDPVLLLDQDAMHHRDLARGPAKAQAGDPEPDAKRFVEADAVAGISSCLIATGIHQAFALLVGQLWVSVVASRHQR